MANSEFPLPELEWPEHTAFQIPGLGSSDNTAPGRTLDVGTALSARSDLSCEHSSAPSNASDGHEEQEHIRDIDAEIHQLEQERIRGIDERIDELESQLRLLPKVTELVPELQLPLDAGGADNMITSTSSVSARSSPTPTPSCGPPLSARSDMSGSSATSSEWSVDEANPFGALLIKAIRAEEAELHGPSSPSSDAPLSARSNVSGSVASSGWSIDETNPYGTLLLQRISAQEAELQGLRGARRAATGAMALPTIPEYADIELHRAIQRWQWERLAVPVGGARELITPDACSRRGPVHGERGAREMPLHLAAAEPRTPAQVLLRLLTAYPAACRHSDRHGQLPLHLACQSALPVGTPIPSPNPPPPAVPVASRSAYGVCVGGAPGTRWPSSTGCWSCSPRPSRGATSRGSSPYTARSAAPAPHGTWSRACWRWRTRWGGCSSTCR